MTGVEIRSIRPDERDWVRQLGIEHWGAEIVVVHDQVFRLHELPGLVAVEQGEPVGLITYELRDRELEIISLDSLREGRGIGTALITAVVQLAQQAGCRRVWLITTNDNLQALGFYQRRGFRLVAVDRGAVDRARAIKPGIPLVGNAGIEIHDELQLELSL